MTIHPHSFCCCDRDLVKRNGDHTRDACDYLGRTMLSEKIRLESQVSH